MLVGGVIGRKKYARKKTKKRLCKKQIVFTPEDDKNDFAKFMKAATCKIEGKGSYGYVLKLTLPENKKKDSPYVHLDGSPVMTIVLKLSVVVHPNAFKKMVNVHLFDQADSISTVHEVNFDHENTTQMNIYNNSLKQFNFAICPKIVHSEKVPSQEFLKAYPKIAAMKSCRELIKEINPTFSIGMIAMETYPNVTTLSKISKSLISNNEFYEVQCRVMYLLMKLAVLGYDHGDPSENNVLMIGERPYLIDFGDTVKTTYKVRPDCMDNEFFLDTSQKPYKPRIIDEIYRGWPTSHTPLVYRNKNGDEVEDYYPNWDWLLLMRKYTPPKDVSMFSDDNWQEIH